MEVRDPDAADSRRISQEFLELFNVMARLKDEGRFPLAYWINDRNRGLITARSAAVRQEVRHEAASLS